MNKSYVSFLGYSDDEVLVAWNKGFAPAIPLELAPNSDFDFDWVLTINGEFKLNKNPVQGWGSCEPMCFEPNETEFTYELLNDLLELKHSELMRTEGDYL